MLAEPTFKNVGLKQGRFVSRATHLDTILFSCLGFRPRTKVFINTHSLLPPASSKAAFFCNWQLSYSKCKTQFAFCILNSPQGKIPNPFTS